MEQRADVRLEQERHGARCYQPSVARVGGHLVVGALDGAAHLVPAQRGLSGVDVA